MKPVKRAVTFAALVAATALMACTAPAHAGDCTGYVVGVQPVSKYNHATGTGFLAVRSGPGSTYAQRGEVYLGDEISVWDRNGNWYYVSCMSGRCTQPYWGQPTPQGWVYGKYLSIGGVCP
ncbi:SH3 domain-containing protein [Maritimibacter sp. HL-12]|uniref:SH3 domain-containing protein n=1 Tax=Maritimibacter sp. HL-12 TaxID=1162418 RepID=UPI000A0F13DC|nr:SH3 domain-containing protein [Maritimibacter sp. HL-12]SMH55183.1 SH3 domain-containing protein [Maritimibacter sp. HL-12]